MEELIKQYEKVCSELINAFNDTELVIIVKNGKTSVIENGKQVKYVKRVEFTSAMGEVPEIIIQKGVI